MRSEDHDHAEGGSTSRWRLAGEVETLRLPLPATAACCRAFRCRRKPAHILDRVRAKFPGGPNGEKSLASLEPSPADTMGSWFSRILMREAGVVVVERGNYASVREVRRRVRDRAAGRSRGIGAPRG